MGSSYKTWEGGEVRLDRNGAKVFVIRAMKRGIRYNIAIDQAREPRAELALFRRDPVAYKVAHDAAQITPLVTPFGGPVINADLLLRYKADVLEPDSEHLISEKQAKVNVAYLEKWMAVLQGKPLNKVSLMEYKHLLKGLKPRRQHISALRALTHWMRGEGLLASSEDASRDLKIPQAGALRGQRETGYTMETVERIYAGIKQSAHGHRGKLDHAQAVRDVIVLRALCGIHHAEIARIARGDYVVRPLEDMGEIVGVVEFVHKKSRKTGLTHPQSLNQQAFDAVGRLQKRRVAPSDSAVVDAMNRAAQKAGLGPVRPSELRHSFITWGGTYGRAVHPKMNAGVSRDIMRQIVGHTSEATTQIYNGAIPPLVILPIKLVNDEDLTASPVPGSLAPVLQLAR